MEEKLKYYTPKIEEFHVGFEYELLGTFLDGTIKSKEEFENSKWKLQIFGVGDAPYIERALPGKNEDNERCGIRVKRLNKTDIESLGFELTQNLATDNSDEWHIRNKKDNVTIGTFYEHSEYVSNLELVEVNFWIKNKSEFKKLLNQIGLL